MDIIHAKKVVERFWALPKVEHGQAQVPYFYEKAQMDELNEASRFLADAGIYPKRERGVFIWPE